MQEVISNGTQTIRRHLLNLQDRRPPPPKGKKIITKDMFKLKQPKLRRQEFNTNKTALTVFVSSSITTTMKPLKKEFKKRALSVHHFC